MLLAIIQVYTNLGATDFALLSVSEINLESQKILWLKALLQQQGADLQIYNYNSFILVPSASLWSGDKNKEEPGKRLVNDCKALVLFGDNISTNIHYKPYNRLIKYLVEMPSSLEPILTGVLISDGFLKKNKNGNTYLYLKQSPKNFEYLWFLFTKFSHYCSSYPALASRLLLQL